MRILTMIKFSLNHLLPECFNFKHRLSCSVSNNFPLCLTCNWNWTSSEGWIASMVFNRVVIFSSIEFTRFMTILAHRSISPNEKFLYIKLTRNLTKSKVAYNLLQRQLLVLKFFPRFFPRSTQQFLVSNYMQHRRGNDQEVLGIR